MTRRILVTGANGFVGAPLCRRLAGVGGQVRGAMRARQDIGPGIETCTISDLGPDTDWSGILAGVDAVIHTAARVHMMKDSAADPLGAFRRINCAGTRRLAEQAAAAGVRRFIYVSTVKVMGGERERPYTEADPPSAEDPYGISKREAEEALREAARGTAMEWTIFRPPLIYGPRVKANMLALVKAVAMGIPLPLGAVNNRRSMIFVGNFVDALVRAIEAPGVASGTYLISDGEDISIAELLRRLGRHLGRHALLVPVPPSLLRSVGKLLGKEEEMARLLGSFAVDMSRLRHDMGWHPPFRLDEGLAEMARWYRARG